MTNQILEAQNAVSDFDTQIEQAKQDKITTVYEEMFDRAIEKANRLKDKISSINDLITEDMMIDKDTGNLTEMGALSITMNSQQLDTELNNLQTYVKKRQQIMDDFANGSSKSKYGEKTYDELMSENDSAMQESLKNVNNYRQSIISIVTNQATETLIDMAERQQNYAMNGNFKMPELKVKDASGNSVNNVYNTFTVQGDLTRDTLPELNKILDLASSKTQNDIRKNKRRFG